MSAAGSTGLWVAGSVSVMDVAFCKCGKRRNEAHYSTDCRQQNPADTVVGGRKECQETVFTFMQ